MKPVPEINLRAMEPTDVDAVYLLENDPCCREQSGALAPLSRQQLWHYASSYDANPLTAGQLRLIIEEKKDDMRNFAGIVDLYDIDIRNSRAMVGIGILPQIQRRGIALRALKLLEEYVRENLHLALLCADVAEDNHPSAGLFKRSGYRLTGSRPEWYSRTGGRRVAALHFSLTLINSESPETAQHEETF